MGRSSDVLHNLDSALSGNSKRQLRRSGISCNSHHQRNPMTKSSTIGALAFAALLTVSASACAAPLTTSETCVELSAITAAYPSPFPSDPAEQDKAVKDLVGKVEKLAGKASETLKDDVQAMAERVKRNADGNISSGTEYDKEQAAMDRLEKVCKF